MAQEGVASRVGRIIAGGFSMIVEALEGCAPEAIMAQAVREIDEIVQEVTGELGRIVAKKHLLMRRLMEENKKHEDLSEQIEVALREQREDLAKVAIARQLDIEAQIPVLESAVADAAESEHEMEGYLLALRAKRREMERDVAEYRKVKQGGECSVSTAGAAGKPPLTGGGAARADRVERASSAFDRAMDMQTGVASESSPDQEQLQKLNELERLTRDHRVAERLELLRTKQR